MFNLVSLLKELDEGDCAALCTVVAVSGSTPQKVGAKMLVIDNGTTHGAIKGSVGGGALEHRVRELAVAQIKERRATLACVSLTNDLGMCCGGTMSVFIDPLPKKTVFICFGAGHIAQALCPLMKSLGFLVHVADERRDLLAQTCFDGCSKHNDTSIFSLETLPLAQAFVLIATHSHSLDQDLAEGILAYDFTFAALVGSKRKAVMTKKRMEAKGIGIAQQSRILCPAGLAIGAQTPMEIAVSIMAQLIKVNHERRTLGSDCRRGFEHEDGSRQSARAI